MSKDIPRRKEQDLKKVIKQLKAELRQTRKALRLAEEEVFRIRDAVDDVEIVNAATRLSRGKRKGHAECPDCLTDTMETRITNLGVKRMVVIECTECGLFERNFEELT